MTELYHFLLASSCACDQNGSDSWIWSNPETDISCNHVHDFDLEILIKDTNYKRFSMVRNFESVIWVRNLIIEFFDTSNLEPDW